MKLPHTNSIRYRVLRAIYLHGPMTVGAIAAKPIRLTVDQVSKALHTLGRDGLLVRDGCIYSLPHQVKMEFEQFGARQDGHVAEIVPHRDAPEFRPLSIKNMLPRVSPRDGTALREVSFMTGSAGYFQGYRA